MANAIEELVISLGLDVAKMQEGLQAAQSKLSELGKIAANAAEAVAQGVSGEASQAVAAAHDVSVALTDTGNRGKDAADKIAGAFGGLPRVLNMVRGNLVSVLSAIGASFLSAKGFSEYLKTANGFESLSRKTGIAIEELDAWSRANEAAGGSAEALQSTLESFYKKTGRPATEFFKLGEKIAGMSQLQATRFLEAQGVALDAVPVFLKGQAEAEKLVAKYRQTAFTAEDAKLARAYKNAWGDFVRQAQAVGAVFFRAVLPAFTAVGRFLERLTRIVAENLRVFLIAGTALGIAFGAKHLADIKAMITAVKAFGVSLSTSLLPLTAIVAAVVATGLALDDMMTFAEGGDSMIERMMRSLGFGSEVIEEIRSSFQSLFGVVGKLWDALKPIFGNALTVALKGILGVVTAIVAGITGLIAGIVGLITYVDDLAEAVYDMMPSFEEMGAWFAKVGDWVKGLFSDWLKSFISAFIEPIKNLAEAAKSGISGLWNGAKNLLGLGDGNAPPSAAQQNQLAAQSVNRSATITNTSTMNQVVNVSTRDNPQAIGLAVGNAASGAAGSMNRGAMQAMSGVRLKG